MIEGGTAVKKTVSFGQAVVASEAVLPVRVQEVLGEFVGVTHTLTFRECSLKPRSSGG